VRPLAIVGNLSRDLVGGGPPRVGGAPFYAARALRVLGRPAVVATKCATVDRPELVPALVALGVPVRSCGGESTATFAYEYDGDVRRMRVEALGDPWTEEDARGWVSEALGRAEWVHVGALARSDFPSGTLAALAGRGRTLSFDGQGLVRPARTGTLELDADFERDVLEHVSILKLAEEEAELLAPGLDEEALRALGVPEVVVTLGSRGAAVLAGGRLERIAARPVADGIDPTGAGDAFAAASLPARSEGHAPLSSARRATALVAGLLSARLR
jgi:sugar/nucleoside kinase (ribokinase family)